MKRAYAVIVVLGIIACGPQTPPASTATAPTKNVNETKLNVDTACKSDADCEVTPMALDGSDLCCTGCTWNAATKTSLASLGKWCTANPPKACRPVDCLMARAYPVCAAGVCTASQVPSDMLNP